MVIRELERLSKNLMDWYDQHARILPWRADKDPYRVWVSEIMLQQTRVEAVIPYYEAFLRELPTVNDLANCPEEKLLKLWQGLGYYRRARNMQNAAKMVAETMGRLPSSAEELKKLPGIGAYTAGAIASIAFGKRVAAIDGNVSRVFARLLGIEESPEEPAVAAKIRGEVEAVLPDTRVGDFNQALMELGATVCLPNGKPLCIECPLSGFCQAYKNDLTAEIPKKSIKKERPRQHFTVLVLRCGDRFALEKRPDNALLASLWQFPMLCGTLPFEACQHAFSFLSDGSILSVMPTPPHKHIFTHLQWDMTGFLIELKEIPSGTHYTWATAEDIKTKYSIPSAFKPFRNYTS